MKKIINGKKYDTETAEFLGCDSYSYRGDFHYWSEELYRTQKGTYFLYGEGGPASKYRETVACNEWCGGENLVLLTEKGAREWVEMHLGADDYESIFGEVEEG